MHAYMPIIYAKCQLNCSAENNIGIYKILTHTNFSESLIEIYTLFIQENEFKNVV